MFFMFFMFSMVNKPGLAIKNIEKKKGKQWNGMN